MTGTSQGTPQAGGRYSAYGTVGENEPTGWVGWIAFAGFMLILGSVFQFIAGLVALFNSHYYVVRPSGLAVNVSYTTWGWVHIILAVVAGLTGAGLLAGNMLARWVGVVWAGLQAIVMMVFVAAYPFWSLSIITIDFIVIYAIVAHGREMKSTV